MRLRIAAFALVVALSSFAPVNPVNTDYYLPIAQNGCAQASIGGINFAQSYHAPHANITYISFPQCQQPESVQVWDDGHEVPSVWYKSGGCPVSVFFASFGFEFGPVEPITHTVTIQVNLPNSCAIGEKDYIPYPEQW